MKHDLNLHRARAACDRSRRMAPGQRRPRARVARRGWGQDLAVMIAAGVVLGVTIAAPTRVGQWLTMTADAPHRVPAGASGAVVAALGETMAARHFGLCFTGGGTNCVVDGDTFWIGGEKVRVADIDAPETHPSRCAEEARLGDAATERLQALLNAGPVTLAPIDRDTDRYGRKLRVVERDGRSLGEELVSEGLAREWVGRREPWC